MAVSARKLVNLTQLRDESGHFLMLATDQRGSLEQALQRQRCRSPTAFDRIMASRMGAKAVELILEGGTGVLVAVVNRGIVPLPLREVRQPQRTMGPKTCDLASSSHRSSLS